MNNWSSVLSGQGRVAQWEMQEVAAAEAKRRHETLLAAILFSFARDCKSARRSPSKNCLIGPDPSALEAVMATLVRPADARWLRLSQCSRWQ